MAIGFDSIPNWTEDGFLPVIDMSTAPPHSRSPYPTSLVDLALRFGRTQDRRRLLTGFLDFRAALHEAGLTTGFQWLNGSFVEDIMLRENRDPRDIDVVTFWRLPGGQDQSSLNQTIMDIFNHAVNKSKYNVDAYFVSLDIGDGRYFARAAAYWSDVWSHTRDEERKGYLEIDLSENQETTARATLSQLAREEDTT